MLAASQGKEAERLISPAPAAVLPAVKAHPKPEMVAAVAPQAPTIPKISNPRKNETGPLELSPARLASPEEIAAAPASDATATAAAWPDEQAEAVYLSEARERGELPPTPQSQSIPAEEVQRQAEDSHDRDAPLPSLDELVQKISPEIRQSLEELFRAKFVSVKRISEKNLKG